MEEKFHRKHKMLYGYSIDRESIEVVNARLRTLTQRSKPKTMIVKEGHNEPKGKRTMLFEEGEFHVPVYLRENLDSRFSEIGPAVIEEETATTVIPPNVPFEIDHLGVIHMEVR
jgi:N-methylhydantoinase A